MIGIGKNYHDHAKEMGGEAPTEPLMFLIPNTAVVGPGDPVVIPPQTSEVSYEGELAVVIGRICRDVPAERLALGPVADDDEQRARIVEAREGIDEVAVALPASQRRDDADDARAAGDRSGVAG